MHARHARGAPALLTTVVELAQLGSWTSSPAGERLSLSIRPPLRSYSGSEIWAAAGWLRAPEVERALGLPLGHVAKHSRRQSRGAPVGLARETAPSAQQCQMTGCSWRRSAARLRHGRQGPYGCFLVTLQIFAGLGIACRPWFPGPPRVC